MKIKLKNTKYLVLSLFVALIIGCSLENQVLVTIDGDKYTVADFREKVRFTPADDSIKKVAKVNEFIDQMLMVKEASERGYDKDSVIESSFETQRKEIISRSYYEAKVIDKVKVSDSDVRKIYNDIIDYYHFAEIVVAEESLAQYIEGELKKGVPFDSLLPFSLDTMTANGDIGEFSAVSIPPEILKHVRKLKDGDVTDAIQFGEYFYILKIIGRRKSDTPKFEDVKENIRNNLLREKAGELGEKFINKIVDKAKIEYNQEGLDVLIKPDSMITEEDLDTWVVKKHDTSYVYVRTIRDAVFRQYQRSFIEPKTLIERVLVPDLLYDEAIKVHFDKNPKIKRRLRSTLSLLIYQKFYSEEVLSKVIIDSMDVVDYYKKNKDKFKDKEYKNAYLIAKTTIRDEQIDTLRQNIVKVLHDKYNSEINQSLLVKLLREEK